MVEQLWKLPQLIWHWQAEVEKLPTQLVVAGGRAPGAAWLRQVAAEKQIYCADKGIACCLQAGLAVAELYGDGDSGSETDYARAIAQGTVVHRFPPAKDDTDLQLVLQQLPQGHVLCSGVWGGRFDHLYSNIFSLLQHQLRRGVRVCLADEQEIMLLLQTGDQVELDFQQRPVALSLLPLTATTQVSMMGVQWPLDQAELTMLHPYAISNVPLGTCSCSCLEGAVGLYLSYAK